MEWLDRLERAEEERKGPAAIGMVLSNNPTFSTLTADLANNRLILHLVITDEQGVETEREVVIKGAKLETLSRLASLARSE